MEHYVSETIISFIDFLNESLEAYQEALKDLSDADRETQDILHFIEVEKTDAVTMMRVYKKLRVTREKRRHAKNTIELLQPLVQWHEKYGNVINPLNKKTLPVIQATEIHQINRVYGPKTGILKDITKKVKFEG